MAGPLLEFPCGTSTRGMRKLVSIGSVLCFSVLLVTADTAEERRKRLAREFQEIPAPELPARAAAVVRNTPAAERSQAAVIAVEMIIARNPGAASAVVAAISRTDADAGSAAADAAARALPANAAEIQLAAMNAHPKKDKEIGRGNSGRGNDDGDDQGIDRGSAGENESRGKAGREVRRHEGNSGPGDIDRGNGHANGGVGHGPGPNKPGRQIPERPHKDILPNGKPRPHPPNPPNRPVNPPRPHKYNKPRH